MVENISRDRAIYLLKLSHAQFSIIVRNVISTHIFKSFKAIKLSNLNKFSSDNSSVLFFKPKKEKRFY